jgi:hypothetical protein
MLETHYRGFFDCFCVENSHIYQTVPKTLVQPFHKEQLVQPQCREPLGSERWARVFKKSAEHKLQFPTRIAM